MLQPSTTNIPDGTIVRGAVRIGRTGAKLHPARLEYKNGKPYLWIECSCTGTANGSARNKSQFFEGSSRNCRS